MIGFDIVLLVSIGFGILVLFFISSGISDDSDKDTSYEYRKPSWSFYEDESGEYRRVKRYRNIDD